MTLLDEYGRILPSGNDSRRAQFLAELRKSFVSNVSAAVITIWSVFLFAGGLIFLIYFASILKIDTLCLQRLQNQHVIR